LRVSTNGKQVVVHAPTSPARPYEPLTGQFVLNFETGDLAKKVHALSSRSAEEWFELGMECDSSAESLGQAAEAYQRAVEASPEWVEARINFGTALYQLNRMGEALVQFAKAVELDPQNALAEFNLGCVFEQVGDPGQAIEHLHRAIDLDPTLADAHLNLALAYEKRGHTESSFRHLSLYLRYEPNGAWAEFARSRIARHRSTRPSSPSGKLTPFRRKR
jgi:tetratricopeptide (TPR) repeat protein